MNWVTLPCNRVAVVLVLLLGSGGWADDTSRRVTLDDIFFGAGDTYTSYTPHRIDIDLLYADSFRTVLDLWAKPHFASSTYMTSIPAAEVPPSVQKAVLRKVLLTLAQTPLVDDQKERSASP